MACNLKHQEFLGSEYSLNKIFVKKKLFPSTTGSLVNVELSMFHRSGQRLVILSELQQRVASNLWHC